MPPMLAHVAATNSFTAAFHVRAWWHILRANFGGFAVALVLTVGTYMALAVVMQALYFTLVLCIIVPFLIAFMSAYLTVIGNALYAQAYREGVAKLQPEPV